MHFKIQILFLYLYFLINDFKNLWSAKLPMPFETIKNFPVLKHSSNKKLLSSNLMKL